MEDEGSMPLQEVRMMSMPLQEVRTMSLPLETRMMSLPLDARMMSMPIEIRTDFDMSLALEESGFDMSMPMSMDGDAISINNESDSGSNTVVMVSFLAGFSALLVGAAALFVGIRRKRSRQASENEAPVRLVDLPSPRELNDTEEDASEALAIA